MRKRVTSAAVVLLLALYYVLAVGGAWHKSLTFDEIAHITAGYSYWTTGNFRLQPENGNLPQRVAALPLVGRYTFNYQGTDSWQYSDVWGIGNQFFFHQGNPAVSMLRESRAAMALFGVATGLLVFLWSRRLFGDLGGLIALALFAFSPTTLAHGPLATSDMAAAFFFAASLWCVWLLLHEVTWLRLALSCLAAAGLFLAKFSAPVIALVVVLLVVVRLLRSAPLVLCLKGSRELRVRMRQLAAIAAMAILHAVVVWALVWAAYGFHYGAFAGPGAAEARFLPGDWAWVFSVLPPDSSWAGWALQHATAYHLLPEAFLFGFADSLIFAGQRSAFLLGQYSSEGWWWFFPYAFLVKTTLWEFAAVALGLLALFKTRSFYATTPLWALVAVYWAATIESHLNIGHRHILPTYPILFILAGAAAYWFESRNRVAKAATAIVVAGLAVETLLVFPNYIAYFNLLIGGHSSAYKKLVDSSLDWGQDLPGLKTWLEEQQRGSAAAAPVYLSYFGTSDPDYYGISAQHLPFFLERPIEQPTRPLQPGVYCISATMFQGIYVNAAPPPWRKEYEDMYQARRQQVESVMASEVANAGAEAVFQQVGRMLWNLKAQAARDGRLPQDYRAQLAGELQRLQQADAAAQARMVDNEGRQFFAQYEQLRFARLCAYLHRREPDTEINYSILVFRLTGHDLDEALSGPSPGQ